MSIHLYDAVFFDFDGTLADSYDAIAASVNHLRERRGHAPLTTAEVKGFVGRGPAYLLTNTVPGAEFDVDYPIYRDHHPRVMAEKTWLFPQSKNLLTFLKTSGKKIALCSNKPRVFSRDLLRHLAIEDLFDAVIGPEDVPRPKPAPDMLHLAMKQLNVPRDRVLYVGDMTVDIETARGAGVTVWIVPTGSDSREILAAAKPDRLLADLGEILRLFEPQRGESQ